MLVGALEWSTALFATIAAGIVIGVVVSLWVARHAGRRPAALQIAVALALVAALAVIADGARGVDGFLAALRGPLPHLLMLLVVLHGFEVVDRRTMRVHQAITFVVAAYAAGLRLDDALGWWIAVWGAALIASMLLTTRSAPTRRSGIPTPASALRPIAWVGAAAIATLAVLSVVPVPDGPARLGLPAQSARSPEVSSPGGLASPDGSPAPSGGTDRGAIGDATGYPGFTEQLDTSLRGDLGDDVVMRVRAPEPAFWRGQTFSDFDGRSWSVSPDLGARQDGPIIDVPPSLGDVSGLNVPTEQLIQTYYVEAGLPNVVFAAARPTQVIFDGSLWIRPDGAMRSDVTLAPDSIYTVISERVAVTADLLRAQGNLGDFFAGFRTTASGWQIDPFLELPDSTTPRTIDLAASLRAPGESTYDTILRYERWLAANTEYDLDAPVPADGADAVDDFLFVSRRGFCEQIASSLAIMLRSQGVPTRLVTGYVPGERDRVSGVWKVRERDAHAWVEVWFPQTGWQAFDPTAAVPLAGEADAGTVGGDLLGAAASSIASHRVELGLLTLAAMIVWLCVRALASLRRRRDRGRWGLLQDRFAAVGRPVLAGSIKNDTVTGDTVLVMTNPRRAALLDGPDNDLAASIAATLDRAAFDPAWVDDDELYERTRQAVAALERDTRG
jgi:transglutaminase-like putative cysteine protease